MPYTLTTPLVSTITGYQIKKIAIDMDANNIIATIARLDSDGDTGTYDYSLSIFDSGHNILMPTMWPDTNPTGQQMYSLIEQFIFLSLQDQPGDNGIGEGTIT